MEELKVKNSIKQFLVLIALLLQSQKVQSDINTIVTLKNNDDKVIVIVGTQHIDDCCLNFSLPHQQKSIDKLALSLKMPEGKFSFQQPFFAQEPFK